KTNARGEVKWETHLISQTQDELINITRVLELQDNGYAFIYNSNNKRRESEICIMILDKGGNIVGKKKFASPGNIFEYTEAILSCDGSIIVVSNYYNTSNNRGLSDGLFLLKIN